MNTWWGVSPSPVVSSINWNVMAKFWWLSAIKDALALLGYSTLKHSLSQKSAQFYTDKAIIIKPEILPAGFGANALVLIYNRQVHVVDGNPGRDFHFELRMKDSIQEFHNWHTVIQRHYILSICKHQLQKTQLLQKLHCILNPLFGGSDLQPHQNYLGLMWCALDLIIIHGTVK